MNYERTAMTVAELIRFLKKQPQHAKVAYSCCSEWTTMEATDISVGEACIARPDGWVQRERPDMACETYLFFPGN